MSSLPFRLLQGYELGWLEPAVLTSFDIKLADGDRVSKHIREPIETPAVLYYRNAYALSFEAIRVTAPRKRNRSDPRHEATRNALLETAEAMFAVSGINGVSLRQIGLAVGSANANVVGYYFGDKEALIEAILLKHRLPVEEERLKLWGRARDEGRDDDLLVLMNVLWRPLFEKTNSEGQHTYAAFLGNMSRSRFHALRLTIDARLPATPSLVKRIKVLSPHLTEKVFRARLHVLSDLITGTLQRIDLDGEGRIAAELLYADALRMAKAILLAPGNEDEQCDGSCSVNSLIFV